MQLESRLGSLNHRLAYASNIINVSKNLALKDGEVKETILQPLVKCRSFPTVSP
ncbi:hypothetical protein CCP3SC5AM1_1920004 [Gammaproteobacteria bacterium]